MEPLMFIGENFEYIIIGLLACTFSVLLKISYQLAEQNKLLESQSDWYSHKVGERKMNEMGI